MRFGFRNHEGDKGQALVELAMTMSLLVLMLLGAIELGRVVVVSIEVTGAAQAAAQYGAQGVAYVADNAGMLAQAQNDANELKLMGSPAIISFPNDPVVVGICSDETKCTGTDPHNSNIPCSNSDCPNSHILRTVTVTTSSTFDPLIHLPGFTPSFTLYGKAKQQVLNQ